MSQRLLIRFLRTVIRARRPIYFAKQKSEGYLDDSTHTCIVHGHRTDHEQHGKMAKDCFGAMIAVF